MNKTNTILVALMILCAPITFGQVNLDSSLVIHLPFDTTMVEKIGNLSLTNNGATWDKDRNGRPNCAFRFDGQSNITVTGAGQVMPQGEITVTFWARTLKTAIQSPLILNPDVTSNRFNIHIHYYHNGSNASFWDYGSISNSRLFKEGITLDTNEWEFYTFTSSSKSSKMKIYRNNVLSTESNKGGGFTKQNADLMVGGFINQAKVNVFYYGLLDDIRIYGRVISMDEMDALYTGKSASVEGFRGQNQIRVFPNPFQGTFHIDAPNNENLNIKVYNAIGQEISYSANQNNYTINTNDKGVYYVVIETAKGTEVKKMIRD